MLTKLLLKFFDGIFVSAKADGVCHHESVFVSKALCWLQMPLANVFPMSAGRQKFHGETRIIALAMRK
jgi:hypothetical protein